MHLAERVYCQWTELYGKYWSSRAVERHRRDSTTGLHGRSRLLRCSRNYWRRHIIYTRDKWRTPDQKNIERLMFVNNFSEMLTTESAITTTIYTVRLTFSCTVIRRQFLLTVGLFPTFLHFAEQLCNALCWLSWNWSLRRCHLWRHLRQWQVRLNSRHWLLVTWTVHRLMLQQAT